MIPDNNKKISRSQEKEAAERHLLSASKDLAKALALISSLGLLSEASYLRKAGSEIKKAMRSM